MFFRRSPAAEIEPVHRALAEGRYEAALALLEGAAKRQRQRSAQAQLELHIAATYALYGEDGLEGGLEHLAEAAHADAAVAHTPLYRALYWEFAAYRGEAAGDVKRGAAAAAAVGESVAAYHAASALAAIHAFKRAVEVLLEVDVAALPDYLKWRYWSLLGRSHEAQGHFEEAVDAFERSAALSQNADKFGELLNLAANRLESQQPVEALEALERAQCVAPSESTADSAADSAVHRYLTGRAHLSLGNPNTALNLFLEASVLESAAGEPSFSLQLALGQTYSALGKTRRAEARYQEAVQLASKRQRALALHEYALVMVEADRLERAKELLVQASSDEHYDYHAEVYADLADVELRLGDLRAASDLAHRALDLGATAPACLTLGNVAHEYYRFDEAIVWFEKAASASVEGHHEWVFAKEMLVDSFVQQGYKHPDRVIHHAEAVLRHLPSSNEWTLLLRGYIAHAKTLLGGHQRMLN